MFVYLNGLLLGLSLIMALGPQNMFLIKQGARRNHPGLSAIVCFICDALLACASVAGLHQLVSAHPTVQIWMICLGSIFLLYYAMKALFAAFSPKKAAAEVSHHYSKTQIIIFALGFSLLNPHAIIDTLVIIGSGSSQFPNHEFTFLFGVVTASLLWFSSLVMTTQYFSPILAKGNVWRIIELFSGVLMAFIGIKLALSGLGLSG